MTIFPMHGGAKTAHWVAGVLCCLLVIAFPFGVWFIFSAVRGRVEMTKDAIVVRVFFTTTIPLTDVQRLGVFQVPIVAGGIGGVLARKKVGGSHAIHLCVMDRAGKTKKFIVSMFEKHQEIIDQVAGTVQRPIETLAAGGLGPKWPDAAAA